MSQDNRAVIIVSPCMGIYIGSAMGMGFWTGLDEAGQDAACTFPDKQSAREHIASWACVETVGQLDLLEVEPDLGEFVSFEQLRQNGLAHHFRSHRLQ